MRNSTTVYMYIGNPLYGEQKKLATVYLPNKHSKINQGNNWTEVEQCEMATPQLMIESSTDH